MDEFLSEKEQVERMRQWWGENGWFVVAGLVMGLALLAGWNAWKQHREARADEGAEAYVAMSDALRNSEFITAAEIGARLVSEYQDTPYADQAGFALAKYHLGQSRPDLAAGFLTGVLERTTDDEIRHIARLRLARVQMEQAAFDTALATLTTPNPGEFAARYHELRGDAHFGLGDHDTARDEYLNALSLFGRNVVNTNLVQMKLQSLARVRPVETAPVELTETDETS